MPDLVHHHFFDHVIEETVDDLLGLTGQHRLAERHLLLHAVGVFAAVAALGGQPLVHGLAQLRLAFTAEHEAFPVP